MRLIGVLFVCLLVVSCGQESSKDDGLEAPRSDGPGEFGDDIEHRGRGISQAFVLFDHREVAEKQLLLLFKSSEVGGKVDVVDMVGPGFLANTEKSRATFGLGFVDDELDLDQVRPTSVDTMEVLLKKFSGGTVFHFAWMNESLCNDREHTFKVDIEPIEAEGRVTSTIVFRAHYLADGRCKLLKSISTTHIAPKS